MKFNKFISNTAIKAEKLVHAFFDPEIEKDFRFLGFFVFCVIFLAGAIWWISIFNYGKPGMNFRDWSDINIPRLYFLQQAIRLHVFPWHMSYTPALHGTDRFFSLPDVITSPQVLLLALMNVRHFFFIDFMFYYTIATCSMIWIKRLLNLSLAAVCFFFFLFNFNGYLVAHYSIGHITWASHFLFPLFFALMIRFSQGMKGWRWVAATAFLMFFIILAGGSHQFTWLLIFILLMIPAYWRRAGWLLAAMLFAGLLSAVRLLPPGLELERFSLEWSGIPAGYPSVMSLIQYMVYLVGPTGVSEPLRYWEFNLFVGIIGAIFIIFFGLVKWINNLDSPGEFSGFILPVMGLVFFSLSDTYSLVKAIPFPLFQGERVISRMIDVPFVFLLIVAVFYFQKWLSGRKHALPFYVGIAGLFLWMVHDLRINSNLWSLDKLALISDLTQLDFSQMNLVSNHPDPVYFTVFYLGLAITLITMATLLYLSLREYKRKRVLQKSSEITGKV
jgi:hypothetical protein